MSCYCLAPILLLSRRSCIVGNGTYVRSSIANRFSSALCYIDWFPDPYPDWCLYTYDHG